MIVMNGICSMCTDGKEKRLAKRKPPLCGYHYTGEQRKKSIEKNKDKPKKVFKPISKGTYKYKRKPTGELEIFKEIWEERPHESFINGEALTFFDVSNMAHVISKAENKYPKFKLKKENIRFLTRNQHEYWDKGSREELRLLPEWNKMFELESELIIEYRILHGK